MAGAVTGQRPYRTTRFISPKRNSPPVIGGELFRGDYSFIEFRFLCGQSDSRETFESFRLTVRDMYLSDPLNGSGHTGQIKEAEAVVVSVSVRRGALLTEDGEAIDFQIGLSGSVVVSESIILDVVNGLGDDDFCQVGAAEERVFVNDLDRAADHDTREVGAALERFLTDYCDGVGDDDILQCVAA